MNRKIKTTVLIVVVLVIGLVIGTFLSSWLYMRNAMAPFYSHRLLEIAIDAQQLSLGKASDVLKRKIQSMPSLTNTYYSFFYNYMPKEDSRNAPLWQVEKYYEISGEPIPAEIKPILESLPPRPITSCELKRRENESAPLEK